MKLSAVSHANVTKPDPDQPWRYVCPDCGGQVHNHETASKPWQCDRCWSLWSKDELHDKKTDGEVLGCV